MATGANDNYWKDARLPGVLKHSLLKRYLPVFLIRTSSIAGRAAYFDGFAGRGVYDDGKLGSAGQMLEFAAGQQYGPKSTPISLYLCEKNPESFAVLDELCNKYRAKHIDVSTRRDDAASYLRDSLPQFAELPAFLFLDPCGVGIPFEDLVAALNRGADKPWPPTEVLINFSLEAVRRIGGHVTSRTPNETTMQTLDTSLGGDWWRTHFERGVTDEAVNAVVEGFARRLSQATKMTLIGIPVRRAPTHKPIYHLIFGTRHPAGIWNFAHCAAKATEDWWAQVRLDEERKLGPALFETSPRIIDVEKDAVPVIAANIQRLIEERGEIRLGDFPVEVFGEFLGRVRESAARQAVKLLFKEGATPSTGVGPKVENLRVAPTTQ
ncbi:three-Cys-motif partner protein TcmP [Mycolicibacterium smegmatis]|uniref:three-Cys-motif partner protein TcmP n=1 Tax=Mycolicibacterium smegmatis TaxID=1772 RepID=UPI001E5D943C|nr:three-Cys-motif partner protein TcmP [Mycolicibacterium smegmatis]UGU31369.1 three-Cys-motif partner protein TcmP [Mycolicibacterium smegmatis]ULN72266.1 three-Cys-motif partner protein TcmP [Mycolicibacterium smegmatis]